MDVRTKLVGAALVCVGAFAVAQEPTPPARYGVAAAPGAYPQGTPKDAVASVIKAAEKGRAEYLAAHLLDPKTIDARVEARAKEIEIAVERELRLARDEQVRQGVPRRERLPSDAAEFAAVVRAETQTRAFALVARDVRTHLAEYPEHLKEFSRYQRDGLLIDTGETATFTLKDVKDTQLSLRKVGTRWHVGDAKGVEPVDKK